MHNYAYTNTVGEETDIEACKVLTDNAENLNSAICVVLRDSCSASIRVPDVTERGVSVAKKEFDLGTATLVSIICS